MRLWGGTLGSRLQIVKSLFWSNRPPHVARRSTRRSTRARASRRLIRSTRRGGRVPPLRLSRCAPGPPPADGSATTTAPAHRSHPARAEAAPDPRRRRCGLRRRALLRRGCALRAAVREAALDRLRRAGVRGGLRAAGRRRRRLRPRLPRADATAGRDHRLLGHVPEPARGHPVGAGRSLGPARAGGAALPLRRSGRTEESAGTDGVPTRRFRYMSQ